MTHNILSVVERFLKQVDLEEVMFSQIEQEISKSLEHKPFSKQLLRPVPVVNLLNHQHFIPLEHLLLPSQPLLVQVSVLVKKYQKEHLFYSPVQVSQFVRLHNQTKIQSYLQSHSVLLKAPQLWERVLTSQTLPQKQQVSVQRYKKRLQVRFRLVLATLVVVLDFLLTLLLNLFPVLVLQLPQLRQEHRHDPLVVLLAYQELLLFLLVSKLVFVVVSLMLGHLSPVVER